MPKRRLTQRPVSTTQPVFFDQRGRRWTRSLVALAVVLVLIGGFAAWVWRILQTPLWPPAANSGPSYPQSIVYSQTGVPTIGEGLFTRIDRVQRDGAQTLLTDPFSNTTFRPATQDELATIGAHEYVAEAFGTVPARTLVLTFDDGPDATYTPALLDILSRNHVPAVFFTIGSNVLHNDELFQRIVREGHQAGNHTFSHIDFDEHGTTRDQQELIAADRVMRTVASYSTRLFRLPYGDEANNLFGILTAQQLGYIHVGFDLDTNDWEHQGNQKVPVPNLDGAGHIVLMHDGGGNRQPTLELVQSLINEARSKGYTFTTLTPILPPAYQPTSHIVSSATDRIAWASLWSIGVLPGKLVYWLTWFGASTLWFMSLASIVLAFVNYARQRRQQLPDVDVGLVSVLIAAHNEAPVIAKTIMALQQSTYRNLEVVVVDDGSTDATLAILRYLASYWPKLRVITQQPNQGKPVALNNGILHTHGHIIVTLDADTVFTPDTITNLVRHFADPQVGAVAGHIKVGNRHNILTAWQSLEYISGICVTRMAEGLLGAIMIAPGACAAWRKTAVLHAGGWPSDTLAEDCDLTLAVQCLGYKVAQDNDAVAWTEAPMTIASLAKQRLRWTFGNIQVYRKYRHMVLRPRYGWLGMVVMPYALISILVPLVFMPLTYVTAVLSLVAGNWQSIALFAAFVAGVHLAISVVALGMAHERPWHLLVVPLYRLIYEPLRTYLLYASLVKILRGRSFGWYKPNRTNSVALQRA